MKQYGGVTNDLSWKNICRKVVAPVRNLEEKIGVIVCAREMCKLVFWLRAEEDPDSMAFRAIESETDILPAGSERQRWSAAALKREDEKIMKMEN